MEFIEKKIAKTEIDFYVRIHNKKYIARVVKDEWNITIKSLTHQSTGAAIEIDYFTEKSIMDLYIKTG